MFCPDCGAENPGSNTFCEQCGANLAPIAAPVPPASVPVQTPSSPSRPDVGWFGTAGIIVALISTVVIPIIFGPIAIVLGFIGHSRGDPRGKIAIALGVVCMLIGFALSYILFIGI
jgi:hypothetical protein